MRIGIIATLAYGLVLVVAAVALLLTGHAPAGGAPATARGRRCAHVTTRRAGPKNKMDRAPEIVKAVQAAQGAAAAAALVQQDPSSQIELELPIDAFAGDADHQKQIHQDFWQGFDPKDLGESND